MQRVFGRDLSVQLPRSTPQKNRLDSQTAVRVSPGWADTLPATTHLHAHQPAMRPCSVCLDSNCIVHHKPPTPRQTPSPPRLASIMRLSIPGAAVGGGVSRAPAVRVSCAYRDSRALRDLKVKQNKHILSTYNKAYAFFPKVKFVLKHNSRLGEQWKLCGSASGLGNWCPEISPTLSWREGGVWSAEVALPPGHYTFKCLLRTADGAYVWESGENRTIDVPVKDRPGHFVMTYNMDVRAEPVDTLMGNNKQQGNYSRMPAWGDNVNQQPHEALERAMANNNRVPANAW